MVKDELDNAYELVRKGDSVSAFKVCERLLLEHPQEKIKILRQRSHMNAYITNIENALSDRLEVISLGLCEPQDMFFAGVYSLELRKYSDAIELFSNSIENCGKIKNNHYLEESYLLRAYANLGVKNLEHVSKDCMHVGDDIEYFIEGDGPISKKRLLSFISKQT